jgi:hypothetical protein
VVVAFEVVIGIVSWDERDQGSTRANRQGHSPEPEIARRRMQDACL